MIKRTLLSSALLLTTIALNAQIITFAKVIKTNDNQDKNIYSSTEEFSEEDLLAQIEIDGYTSDDALVYSQIYKKAKEVGANIVQWQPPVNIDGRKQEINLHNYKLNLYYREQSISKEGIAYIFGSPTKDVKITLNNKKLLLPARSYIKYNLAPGKLLELNVGGFLGSRIKVKGSTANDEFYFQISGGKLGAEDEGLKIKSGDIVGVDPSFGEFLKIIYKPFSIAN